MYQGTSAGRSYLFSLRSSRLRGKQDRHISLTIEIGKYTYFDAQDKLDDFSRGFASRKGESR